MTGEDEATDSEYVIKFGKDGRAAVARDDRMFTPAPAVTMITEEVDHGHIVEEHTLVPRAYTPPQLAQRGHQ